MPIAKFSEKYQIDLPVEKGIHIKTAGRNKEKFVYKYLEHYRDELGKKKHRSILIGKFHAETGKMSPNDNYFNLYPVNPFTFSLSSKSYGFVYLVFEVAKKLNLLACLSEVFGKEKSEELIAIAAYIISEGNVMDGIDDWQQDNYLPDAKMRLTSQSTSRTFSKIGDDCRRRFFTHWIKNSLRGDSACYDVTSVSSYSGEMPSVERGYNRDGESLSQFNVGIFCDELGKTPLFYSRYTGSLTDKTNLPFVLAEAKALGLSQVKLFLDGGFWSPEGFKQLKASVKDFTLGMPSYLAASKDMIEHFGDEMRSYANKISYPDIYCREKECTVHGVEGKMLLYFDLYGFADHCRKMDAHIKRLEQRLGKLVRYPKAQAKEYSRYFDLVELNGGKSFEFSPNPEKIDAEMHAGGYFLLFTSDVGASPDDLLFFYRAKDTAEKLFAQVKIEMHGNRARTHTEETTDGKIFVTFLASIIRTEMTVKLSPLLRRNSTSIKKVISKLSTIKITQSQNGLRLYNALTKSQREILEAFDLDIEKLEILD